MRSDQSSLSSDESVDRSLDWTGLARWAFRHLFFVSENNRFFARQGHMTKSDHVNHKNRR